MKSIVSKITVFGVFFIGILSNSLLFSEALVGTTTVNSIIINVILGDFPFNPLRGGLLGLNPTLSIRYVRNYIRTYIYYL